MIVITEEVLNQMGQTQEFVIIEAGTDKTAKPVPKKLFAV